MQNSIKTTYKLSLRTKTLIAKAKLHILTVTIMSPWRLTKPNILHMLITGRSYTSSPSTYILVNTPYSFFSCCFSCRFKCGAIFLSLLLTLQMLCIFLVASLDISNRTQFTRSIEKGVIYKLNIL